MVLAVGGLGEYLLMVGLKVAAFRFGVQLAEASSRAEWIDKARTAEALGYGVVTVPDHVGELLSPLPAVVSIAEATETSRVGALVLDNDFRHPLLMAQEAATVQLLTDGRFDLGVGAGWMIQDYEHLGIEFDPAGVRVERLGETLEILDLYFKGEPFSYDGRHYRVTEPEPLKLPGDRPRLVVGGGGRRVLELAALHADVASVFLKSLPDGSGFKLGDSPADTYRAQVDLVLEACERDEPPEINVLLQSADATNDRMKVAAKLAAEWETTTDEFLRLPFGLIGTPEQMTEDLLERRERLGISYVTVFEKDMQTLAPVIERLADR